MKTRLVLNHAEVRTFILGKPLQLPLPQELVDLGVDYEITVETPIRIPELPTITLDRKPPVKVKSRRTWSPAKRAQVLAYAQAHGYSKTLTHYKLSSSILSRWRREAKQKGGK